MHAAHMIELVTNATVIDLQQRSRKTLIVGKSRIRRTQEILRATVIVSQIIQQRLDAAQKAVRTCSLERDSKKSANGPVRGETPFGNRRTN